MYNFFFTLMLVVLKKNFDLHSIFLLIKTLKEKKLKKNK